MKLFTLTIIASLFLLGSSLQLNAQELITFDFKTKKFSPVGSDEKLQKLKLGNLYQLKIDNINTLLYKISIGKRDSITQTEKTMPAFGTFGIDALKSLVSGLSTGNLLSAPIKQIITTNDPALKSNLKQLFYGTDFKNGLNAFLLDNGVSTQPKRKETIIALMSTYETLLKDSYNKLGTLKTNTDDLVNDYNKFLIQAQIEDKSNPATSSFFTTTGLTPDNLYTKLNQIRRELNQLNQEINTANTKYLKETEQYSDDIKNSPELKANDEELKATYTLFSSTVTKAIDVVSPENAMKLINSVITTINNDDRSYTSLPLQFTKDVNTLVFSIVPRKEDSGLQPYTTSFTFPLKKDSFWAVSSGLYISPLHNHSYSVQTNVNLTDTNYTIHSENPAKMEFGVNAIMRYGTRIDKMGNSFWQIGFGPGLSISDKVRPRVMLGSGLAFGSRSKMIVDIGVIAGYQDKLSILYKEGNSYQTAPNPVTISRLNANVYFSIGYLFN